MNVTYLLGARDRALRQKPDENSGVAWFTPREALEASTEPWMVQRVYSKLTQRAAAYMAGKEAIVPWQDESRTPAQFMYPPGSRPAWSPWAAAP